jgi:hypothetical protein
VILTSGSGSGVGTTEIFAVFRKQHSESTVIAVYFELSKSAVPNIVVFGIVNHTIHMNGVIYDPTLGRMLQAISCKHRRIKQMRPGYSLLCDTFFPTQFA